MTHVPYDITPVPYCVRLVQPALPLTIDILGISFCAACWDAMQAERLKEMENVGREWGMAPAEVREIMYSKVSARD